MASHAGEFIHDHPVRGCRDLLREVQDKGITERGIMYWIIQRVQLGGAPTIPDLDRGLIEDMERVGRPPK